MKVSESVFSQCLYFSTNALARKTEKLAQESWGKVDLTPSHAYLLLLVLDRPGIQPGVISSELQLKPSTITRLIAKLEEKNLLYRTTEGKIANVFPTAKGKSLLPELKACQEEFCTRYLGMLGKSESDQFVSNILKVADKIRI